MSVQTFGRYELLERVSVGGMAEIFRANDPEARRIVAIKRILPEVAADDEFTRMFRDEAKIISQLEHPNICRILDLGRVGLDYYLALEFVDGLDLRAVFDRAVKERLTLPLGFVMHVFSAVCEGLEYAHHRRDPSGRPMAIVHRDVSPQNVLVGFDGAVKLIDFGIAKAAGKLSRTQVGTIKGKYGYMSPEQVRGLPIDQRSDLFSLGICLWELLTLERAFALDNELLIMDRISNAQIPPPSRKNPAIPEALDQILSRALAREASDRYPSAADLYADLQAFAFSENLLWQTGHVADYMARTFGRRAAKPSASGATAQPSNSLNKFPGSPPTRGPGSVADPTDPSLPLASFVAARVQEQPMSDNKGSDLDVFEGLTSKRGPRPPGPSNAPPPPPSRSVPPPPPGRSRQPTMVGMAPPLPPPPSGPRTSTPPIAPPPSRAGGAPPPPPPSRAAPPPPPPPTPPAAAAPPPAPAPARAATVDMDWDDEDEKTHIYDKDQVAEAMGPSPSAPPKPLPPPPSTLKGTQVGTMQPLPPPPSRSAPPAPLPPPSAPVVAAAPVAPAPTPMPAPAPMMPPNTPVPSGMGPSNPLAATQIATAASAFPQGGPAPAMGAPMNAPMGAPMNPPMGAPMNAPMNPPMGAPAPMAAPAPMPAPAPAPRPIADATQVVRPKSSNTGLILGGIALAAVAGVATFFFMNSRPGNVLVNVNIKGPKSGLKVFLDQSEKCSDTTCRIEGVPPGVHAVKAMIGEAEAKATITVEAGKDAVANLNLEIVSKKTGLTVASAIDGMKVEIDDGKAEKLPLKEFELKPGKHKLKFSAGSKYGTKEVDINVEEGQIKALDDVKLPLKAVKTKFVFLTKGLKAQLDDGKTKTDLKDDGQPIELDTSKSYTVTANATGFEDFSKKLDFGDDAEMTVKLELTEKGKAAPPATTTAPPATTTAPPATTTPPAAAGGDGTLFVNTLPPSACVVNGTPRGKTPLTIKLPAGPATVTCVAKDGEDTLKKSGSATVKAGEKATLILKLRD